MTQMFKIELGGREMSVEIGKLAELAGGSALVRYGGTAVLVTATASEKPRPGIDFFPLSVDYEERLYSVGKIPGGFIKREGRPTERAVLTSRLIDRPIRPLFPKDYRNDVAVVATVLSVDQDCSPEAAAMLGASVALSVSDIPFKGPIGAINLGCVGGEFVTNPTQAQREASEMVLTVASTRKKVMMIEAGANEVSNELMFKAIMHAHEENVKIVEFIERIAEQLGKVKHSYNSAGISPMVYDLLEAHISLERMEHAVFTDSKKERGSRLAELEQDVFENLFPTLPEETRAAFEAGFAPAFYELEKHVVRNMILRKKKRPDGRSADEIRRLEAEVDLLERTHGSALFRRGQTQVLTVATLGSMRDVQILDGLDLMEESKRYMHHYNFPSYSVGETRPSRGPGRREIGHGALAERALLPVLPTEEEFPYAIRLVSEVVSSNGSTSQASVCASSMALMAAGVPIKQAVAGISVGLVVGESDEDFIMLTDIQGLEDFFGDMDFKVAGTYRGITAIQMDIKIDGLTPELIQKSLEQTQAARLNILGGVMSEAISEVRPNISPYAPSIAMIKVLPDKLSEVIGPRGKVIKRLIEESGVDKIDTEDDGRIFVVSTSQQAIKKAVAMIEAITIDPEPGRIYTGKVTRIMKIGAFVEIAPEREGLVHISQLSEERVEKVEDVVKVGDVVKVMLTDVDEMGRVNLSCKAAITGIMPPPTPPRPKSRPPRRQAGSE